MKKKTLTEGGILSSLLKFAFPVLCALFLQSLYGGVDLMVVGRFATTADVSAVATGSMLMQTVTMIITGFAMGITILVAGKIGERKPKEAGEVIGSGIWLFGVLAVVVTLIMVIFTDNIASLLHAPQEAFQKTCEYIRICSAGMIFIVSYNVLGAIFRGIGDSKTPLLTVCIACVCNILGDVVLCSFFDMGAAGAAYATVLSQAVSVFVSLYIISGRNMLFTFSKESLKPQKNLIFSQIKLGAPIALQEFLVGISFIIVQTIVNSINVIASAGVGVAEKLCGFIMLVPSAYMQSMAAFVAQNKGAGRMDRANKALIYGILTSLAAGAVMCSLTFFKGDALASLFSTDSEVIFAAHDYLKAYAVDTLLTAVMFCMVGYYNGIGSTMFVMIQGIVGAMAVRVPLVFLISSIEGVSLFMIGLATPGATFVQILLCAGYMIYLKKRKAGVING